MLTGLYEGKVIFIDDFKSPKEELDLTKLSCHVCKEKMFVKHGTIKRAHLCHYPGTACNFEKLQGEPETEEHRLLKRFMATLLKERFPTATVTLETPVLVRKRIIDVMVVIPPFDYKILVECQVSKISDEELSARMDDYEKIDLADVWWVFKEGVRGKHDTHLLRNRCEFVGFCEFSTSTETFVTLPQSKNI